MATIRRVPAVDHNFQLVITRLVEEGNEEIIDDEEESTSGPILLRVLIHLPSESR